MPLFIALIVIPLVIWLFRLFVRTDMADIIQFFKALALFSLGAGILMLLVSGRWIIFFVALIGVFLAAPALKKWFLKNPKRSLVLVPAVLTRDRALAILGLRGNPSDDRIQRAYIDLMKKNHPDAGGDDAMTAELNAARDFLLEK